MLILFIQMINNLYYRLFISIDIIIIYFILITYIILLFIHTCILYINLTIISYLISTNLSLIYLIALIPRNLSSSHIEDHANSSILQIHIYNIYYKKIMILVLDY